MSFKRWITLWLIIICTIPLLSGCWSREEIEDLAIISQMGIDLVEVDGVPKWRVSVQIIRTGAMGNSGSMGMGGGGGGNGQTAQPIWLVSGIGNTLEDALANIETRSPRRIYMAHANVLVLGERVAREGMPDLIDFLFREREVRLRVWLAIAQGEALQVLQAEPELEKISSIELVGMISKTQHEVSKASVVNLKDFFLKMVQAGSDPTASKVEVFYPTEQQANQNSQGSESPGDESQQFKSIRLNGMAVFRKDRLAGWMGDRATQGYLLAVNEAGKGIIPIQTQLDKPSSLSYKINKTSSSISANVTEEGDISFTVNIKAEGDLGETAADIATVRPHSINYFEGLVAQEIKVIVEEAFQQAQQEFTADIFSLGRILHMDYPNVWRAVAQDWDNIYPNVEVDVNVVAQIRRTGLIGSTPEIK